MAKNEISGVVHGSVVQADVVHGGIHVPQSESSMQRMRDALRDATVRVGEGWGVAVAPRLALTLAALVPASSARSVSQRLVLVRIEESPSVCAAAGAPARHDWVVVELGPGAPVVDRCTGGLCGVLDEGGNLVPLPENAELPEAARANDEWLDLLDPDQLRAGGWGHLPQRLRLYLDVVGKADRDHAYSVISRKAPPLRTIYLSRRATRQSARDDEMPERISADRLLVEHTGVQVIGYPGTGKSSLARRLAATAARSWLEDRAGDFIPVLIPAEALSGKATRPEALADGVVHGLNHHLDRDQLVELFRAEPLPAVPWLVIVDGLDEILEPNSRAKVLDKINDFRNDETHRFLITSRPLDRHGFLGKIDQSRYPTYVLEPFNSRELKDFAARMLGAQGQAQAEEAAASFLERVQETKLQTLAHVPLIATMLCLLYAEKPNEKLPDNQSQLYKSFFEWSVGKLGDLDARARLRNWVARYGPSAEEAVDRMIEHVEPMLRATAYRHHRLDSRAGDMPLLDHAISYCGEAPRGMPSEEWGRLVEEILRVSGLIVQRGADFQFLHQTVEEYLAAGHLASLCNPHSRAGGKWLAPQRRWPWEDLEVRVFLAAQWADRFDLTKILHRLLKWGRWRHNIGFLAALARHGVPLDPALVDRAVRMLLAVVGDPKSESPEWQDCAKWLRDLDMGRAAEALEKLSAHQDTDESRRFEAVRELVTLNVERALPAVKQLIGDTAIANAPRTAIAKHLREADLGRATEVFTALAQSGGQLRVQAAEILCTVLEQGVRPLMELTDDLTVDGPTRLNACEVLIGYDADRGVEALTNLVRSTPEPETLRRAAELLRHADPARAADSLVVVTKDEKAPIDRRFTAALDLVCSFDAEPDLLLSLAMSRDIDREWRIKAVLSVSSHVEARVAVLQDVVASCAESDSYRLTALEKLIRIDSDAGRSGLAKLVRNSKQSDHSRLRAFELVAKVTSARAAVELGAVLTSSSGVAGSVRLAAARTAVTFHGWDAAVLFANVAEDDVVSADDRYEAGLALMRYRSSQGARALVSLSKAQSAPEELRFRALEKAERSNPREAQDGFIRFAESRSARDELRLRAAKKIKSGKIATKVLEELANRAKVDSVRLDAAQSLARYAPDRGALALRQLTSDRRVSSGVKRRAQKEAERLER